MSNIEKHVLRSIAAAAKSAPSWYAVGEFGDVVDPAKPEWKPVHEFCKTFTVARVLALLDELEAKDGRVAELDEKYNSLGVAIDAAITRGVVPESHPLRSRLEMLVNYHKRIAELEALASLEAEDPERNPVLAYADSYRDMAKQGVESVPVWNVITDLERNIAPLFTATSAPVSVPDDVLGRLEHEANHVTDWHHMDEHSCKVNRRDLLTLVNACRAAMLQGADGTLTNEDTKRVGELVMWVKRLAHSLRKANPDSKLQSDAMDYLSRNKLIGVEDVLR